MTRRSYSSNGGPILPFDFDIDGVDFTTSGAVATLDVSELAKLADVDVESVQGVAAISSIFQSALAPPDYARFKAHTRAHNTRPDVLFEIMRDMMEHFGQGNSAPPSRSSTGRPTMNGMSGDSSRSAAWPPPAPNRREFSPDELARLKAAIDRVETIDGQVISGG